MPKKNEIREFLKIAAVVAVFLVIVIGGWAVKSHFEAASYNRLTGGDATTWDAMWVQLRVMGDGDE